MCLNYTCRQTWVNIKGKDDLFSEGKKRIHTSLPLNTLAKAFAGRFLMFLSVFNQTTVWRGCCDLGNNFLKHIYILNFFLNQVNQHAIWDAPGGNLFEFWLSFFFLSLKIVNYSTSIYTWTACKYLPKSHRSKRENKRKSHFQSIVISVFHRLGNRIEDALSLHRGHSLE